MPQNYNFTLHDNKRSAIRCYLASFNKINGMKINLQHSNKINETYRGSILLFSLAVLVFDPLQATCSALLHLPEPCRRDGLRLLHAFLHVVTAAAAAAALALRGRARVAIVVPLVSPREPE